MGSCVPLPAPALNNSSDNPDAYSSNLRETVVFTESRCGSTTIGAKPSVELSSPGRHNDLHFGNQLLNADSNSSNELHTSHLVEAGSLSVDIELQHCNLMHSLPLCDSSSSIRDDNLDSSSSRCCSTTFEAKSSVELSSPGLHNRFDKVFAIDASRVPGAAVNNSYLHNSVAADALALEANSSVSLNYASDNPDSHSHLQTSASSSSNYEAGLDFIPNYMHASSSELPSTH